MRELSSDEKDSVISDLVAYIIKERGAPCSADVHLCQALFTVVESFDEEELKEIDKGGYVADAIVENYVHQHYAGNDVYNRYSEILKFNGCEKK